MITPALKRRLLPCTVILVGAGRAHAYPISPLTLWELTEQAELIVVADVSDISEIAKDSGQDDVFEDAIARLQVKEIWKGTARSTVEVDFPEGLICPAPPRYVKGETVLAFLASEDGRWSTVGLSYGTLYPDAGELDDYRAVVRSAVRLQTSKVATSTAKHSWLVDAASRPATRWHGLYELVPRSDRLHSYYDQSNERLVRAPSLSQADFERIARGFTSRVVVDRTFPMLIAALSGFPDREVDRAVLASIEALLALDEPPWWLRDALTAALTRLGDPNPEAALKPLGESFDKIDPQVARRIWAETKRTLQLPDVPPAEVRKVKVWGVGSNTPS